MIYSIKIFRINIRRDNKPCKDIAENEKKKKTKRDDTNIWI